MMYYSKEQLTKSVATWSVAKEICHMKDKTQLDDRTYLLTINIKKASSAALVAKLVYQEICLHLNLGRKGPIPQHRLPGLAWSLDATGGRRGHIENLNFNPHLHAVMILPKIMNIYDLDIPVISLEERIMAIEGVSADHGASAPVHITRFRIASEDLTDRTTSQQYIDFTSYAMKGEVLSSVSHHLSSDHLTSGTFPFDSFPANLRLRLEPEVNGVMENLNSPSRHFKHFSRCMA
ncbi:MAG TPA: hypothetical protein PKA35_02050 [Paracoccus solventivorans]|uniref:hypothetical protein n=1 Tax=Paracoccus solventivorans TaxID=53463 RepID=UPI002C97A6D9|nr:hypothetical protein [Paracoccus solventivorans]HMM07883.1 hypothetical protein [Paracoccus solventivorans]